jgi:hypothetical protein
MFNLSTATSEAIVGQASFWSQIGNTKGGGILKGISKAAGLYLSEVLGITASRELGRQALNTATGGSTIDNYNMTANAKKIAAAKLKADADAKKRAAQLANLTKANTAELKKQALLKKAGTIFDLDQIQLIAALKGQLSEEDRKRIELQFALITGNTKEAQLLTYELAKAQGLGEKIAKDLASLPQAANPFASWSAYLDEIMKKAQQVASSGGALIISPQGTGTGQGGSVIDNYKASIPQTNVSPIATSTLARLAAPMSSGSSTIGDYLNVTLQIDGKTIASALQDTSLSGIGSSVNRTGR